MRDPGRAGLATGLATLALLLALTHPRVFAAGNDASRWAQIESLVDLRTGAIDGSEFAWTIDRIEIEGRSYSNKPPLLAVAGAVLYAPLQAMTGWRLADPAARPRIVYLLTLLLVGAPAVWLSAAVARAAWAPPPAGPGTGLALAAAIAGGTLLTPFSTTLNNHTVAAALLFAGWLAALGGRGGRAGLAGGLAAAVDIVPGVGLLPVLWGVARRRGGWPAGRRLAAGAAVAAALAVAANLLCFGHPLPAKLIPGALDRSAEVAPSVAGVVLPESWTYPLAALFGWHGLFSLSPVLLFGVAGLWHLARHEGPPGPQAGPDPVEARWLAAGLAAQVAFHSLFAGSFGGWSFGFRYLIPVVPFLLAAMPWALARWRRPLFAALVVPSVAIALLGAYHPWPPGYEQESGRHPVVSRVTNPVGANGAAWLAVHAPESALAEWAGRTFLAADERDRQRYLAYFFWSRGDPEIARRFSR